MEKVILAAVLLGVLAYVWWQIAGPAKNRQELPSTEKEKEEDEWWRSIR